MAWGDKPKTEKPWVDKQPWYSPRALVEKIQLGPNTVRYQAVRLTKKERKLQKAQRNREIVAKFSGQSFGVKKEEKQTAHDYNHGRRTGGRHYYNGSYYNDDFEKESYIEYTPRREYAYSASAWSNFSFSSFLVSDESSTLYVKEVESYMTPTADSIRTRLHVYSKDAIDTVKDLARISYLKMIDDLDYMSEDMKEIINNRKYDSAMDKRFKLYENIADTYVPGFSPLEQAVNFYEIHQENEAKDNRVKDQGERGARTVEFNREHFANPSLNNQVDKSIFSCKHRIQILNRVSIISKMGKQFEVEKETGEKEVANSDVHKLKIMRNYEQFNQVEIYQRILPNFPMKFLTKDLVVRVPVKCSEKKQKIIILCDYSGSMNDTPKQLWVNALLIDRFRYVLEGDAEVFFSFFVSSVYDLHFHHIHDAKSVDEFWKTFSNYPSGSTTDIGKIVKYVADEVKKKKLHNLDIDLSVDKPEILIINDGQDSVNSYGFPYKVNAISLMQFSNQLKTLCTDTGGKQIKITQDNMVYSYHRENPDEAVEEILISD